MLSSLNVAVFTVELLNLLGKTYGCFAASLWKPLTVLWCYDVSVSDLVYIHVRLHLLPLRYT